MTHLYSKQNDALLVFPQELWLKIFKHFKSPTDLQHVYYASPTFQAFLRPQIYKLFIPKALQIVDSQYPFLPASVASIRLVSHFWKWNIENILQTRKSRYKFLFEMDHYLNLPEELEHTFKDPTSYDVQRKGGEHMEQLFYQLQDPFYGPSSFLESRIQREYPWSPIASRHLVFFDKNIPNQTENPDSMGMGNYRHPTFALLKRLNRLDAVWFLDLWVRYNMKPQLWLTLCRNWIRDSPHLKVLQWKFTFPITTDQDLNQMQEAIAQYGVPTLQNLVMLTLDNMPKCVAETALRENLHIQMLQLLRTNPQIPFDVDVDILNRLTNLQKFAVTVFSVEEFDLLEKVNWPELSVFYLNLQCPTVSTKRVVTLISHFPKLDTIVLKLSTGEMETEYDDIPCKGTFPQIQKLKLVLVNSKASMSFLAAFQSLNSLVVIVKEFDIQQKVEIIWKDEKISFHGQYELLQKSNIWEVVPRLQRIKVALKVSSAKDEYREHNYVKYDNQILKL